MGGDWTSFHRRLHERVARGPGVLISDQDAPDPVPPRDGGVLISDQDAPRAYIPLPRDGGVLISCIHDGPEAPPNPSPNYYRVGVSPLE